MRRYFILFIILFCVTKIASADVVINEIAWMGTVSSTNDEWIELYNTGTAPVAIDGWTLKATDGSPSINLTGTISAGGFFLLERTDDSTVPNIPAGIIYSGALSNSGETLTLKNNTEQTIATIDMTSGWTAGNATSKETMQRTNTGLWITALSTPGATNATTDTGNTAVVDNTDTETPPPTVMNDPEPTEDLIMKVEPDPMYSSRMVLPSIFVEQVPAEFNSEVKRDGKFNDLRGRFEWSMGDGSSFVFNQSTPFTYTYQNPGEYIVMLRYYSNVFKLKPDTIHQKTITVIPANITVSENRSNNSIELKNNSTDDIDVGGWKLSHGISVFTFPLYTIIPKGKSINIPQSVHHFIPTNEKLTLKTPNDFVIKPRYINSTATVSNIPDGVIQVGPENLYYEPETSKNIPTPKTNSGALVFIIGFIVLISGALYGMRHLPNANEKLPDENEL